MAITLALGNQDFGSLISEVLTEFSPAASRFIIPRTPLSRGFSYFGTEVNRARQGVEGIDKRRPARSTFTALRVSVQG
ncbi:hypothetical protein PXK52_02530 [Phaeobacter gallaeciensis]|nr:hypothetical protein [Phaeobacter gallaeciensis]MDE4376961.1 hypothetical protein [Phaeobacter gallaeciensis]